MEKETIRYDEVQWGHEEVTLLINGMEVDRINLEDLLQRHLAYNDYILYRKIN